MDVSLTNKNAIVCGSTQGIGRAIADELASLGATLTLVARNEEMLRQVVAQLPTPAGRPHHFVCVDFSFPDEVKVRIEQHLATHPGAHILVNNTGGPRGGPITEAEPDEFLSTFSRHLICNQILAQAVLPFMKKASYGRIINIISTSVKQPIPGLGVSNTIRGAVASWSKTLAGEVASFGITVNNILPGMTRTQRLESLIDSWAQTRSKPRERLVNEMLAEIPARRFAEPSEIARAVAFLASPAASYINGINLPVDGGRLTTL